MSSTFYFSQHRARKCRHSHHSIESHWSELTPTQYSLSIMKACCCIAKVVQRKVTAKEKCGFLEAQDIFCGKLTLHKLDHHRQLHPHVDTCQWGVAPCHLLDFGIRREVRQGELHARTADAPTLGIRKMLYVILYHLDLTLLSCRAALPDTVMTCSLTASATSVCNRQHRNAVPQR